jgi:hypothetical protein
VASCVGWASRPALGVSRHAPAHTEVSQRKAERFKREVMQKWAEVNDKLNYRNKTTENPVFE